MLPHERRRVTPPKVDLFFSDFFGINRSVLDSYGAFDISLVSDLPLFIDPFALFNSKKKRYRDLHDSIIRYLRFLKAKASAGTISAGLLRRWFAFPEIRHTWLGFSRTGNRGSGLGSRFGSDLRDNLETLFKDFGKEKITHGSHLEKLCLITGRVGRDKISDFVTNLVHGHLLEFTQTFALNHLSMSQRREFGVSHVIFNYETESWETGSFVLPDYDGDHVLLTPTEILTKDDTWINRPDLLRQIQRLPDAVPNAELREQISNYFRRILPEAPTAEDTENASLSTLKKFPILIDYYIREKEDDGERAATVRRQRIAFSQTVYVNQGSALVRILAQDQFYRLGDSTYAEAMERVKYLRDVIENKGGHRFFYYEGSPLQREEDVQIMFRLCWYGTASDVSREVNDGRGPADFKVSRGARDKTLVEMKLASNKSLRRNLQKQVEIYQKASDARLAIKVIVFFSEDEHKRVNKILKDLGLANSPHVVLIDGRDDNKPSGSKA